MSGMRGLRRYLWCLVWSCSCMLVSGSCRRLFVLALRFCCKCIGSSRLCISVCLVLNSRRRLVVCRLRHAAMTEHEQGTASHKNVVEMQCRPGASTLRRDGVE